MGWDTSRFFPAFKRAGMLDEAVFQPSVGDAIEFDVEFRRPDQIVLDGAVHSTDYSIEYLSTAVELMRGHIVTINSVAYKVRQEPLAKGNGSFTIALLETVDP